MNRKTDFEYVISGFLLEGVPPSIHREMSLPLDPRSIISITGPRRAGKTFLMYDAMNSLIRDKKVPKGNIIYVNFEHERLRNLDAADLNDMMTVFRELSQVDSDYPTYLFLDEIQGVKDWQKWVNRMYERKLFKMYISGSSSKLLSTELSTELRGRSIDFVVLPLSFREFLRFKGAGYRDPKHLLHSEYRGELLRYLREYLSEGGYPEVVLSKEEGSRLLKSYTDTMIIKDVGERFRIEPSVLRVFFEYVVNNNASYVSGTKIYNYLKTLHYQLARDVPLRFLSHFNEVFAVFPVEIFSHSIKSRKQYPKKVFSVDTGIVTTIQRSEDLGRLMENVVFLELYRKSEGLTEFSISYWKEYGKREGPEVDFVLTKGSSVLELINVTYSSSRDDIKRREVEGIRKATEELNCKKMTLITWDYYEEGEVNYVPLWYWLIRH